MEVTSGYVLHLEHQHNCSVIESVKAGQEIDVLVVPENNRQAQPVITKARRSQDGKDFIVTMPDGEIVSLEYDFLKNSTIPLYKPSA